MISELLTVVLLLSSLCRTTPVKVVRKEVMPLMELPWNSKTKLKLKWEQPTSWLTIHVSVIFDALT